MSIIRQSETPFYNHGDYMYYNTTGLKGIELNETLVKTGKQDDIIREVFDRYPVIELTPFDVESILEDNGVKYPITSIRRSINTLTGKGMLKKTDNRKKGLYGRDNYLWKSAIPF